MKHKVQKGFFVITFGVFVFALVATPIYLIAKHDYDKQQETRSTYENPKK